MDRDDDLPEEETETGSDELLSDDHLRLPEGASPLVRLHAVRAWLARRRHEISIEIGEAALALQRAIQEEPQETRPRRRAQQLQRERQQHAQQAFQNAQQRLNAYEEAQELLEECVAHTTSNERVLVEYYLTLDEIVQNGLQEENSSEQARLQAFIDVQRRVEHVGSPGSEEE